MNRKSFMVLLAVALTPLTSALADGPLTIDANFENGYIGPHRITASDTVEIGPINGNTSVWFCFRIKGVRNRQVRFITEAKAKRTYARNFEGAIDTPVYISYDGNVWLPLACNFEPKDPNTIDKDGFFTGNYYQSFTHLFREDAAWVSSQPPYTNARLARLVQEMKPNPFIRIERIGLSQYEKVPVKCFVITDSNVPDAGKKHALFVGGENAYQPLSSWFDEGLIRFAASDDPVAAGLRKQMVFHVIPVCTPDTVVYGQTHYYADGRAGKDLREFCVSYDLEPPTPDHKLIIDYCKRLKESGADLEVLVRPHCSSWGGGIHCETEPTSEKRRSAQKALRDTIIASQPWRTDDWGKPQKGEHRITGFVARPELFPDALTYLFHVDTLCWKEAKRTVRFSNGFSFERTMALPGTADDAMQLGELTVRSFAEYYGAGAAAARPFVLWASPDVDHGRKGSTVVFRAYYLDLAGQPPEYIRVVIGDQKYPMARADKSQNLVLSKAGAGLARKDPQGAAIVPIPYECKVPIEQAANGCYIEASNGAASRRVPEGHLLPGPSVQE